MQLMAGSVKLHLGITNLGERQLGVVLVPLKLGARFCRGLTSNAMDFDLSTIINGSKVRPTELWPVSRADI